jgi:hypothetical protein
MLTPEAIERLIRLIECSQYEKTWQVSIGDDWACPECDMVWEMSPYAAAHWDEPMTYVCPQCETAYNMHAGRLSYAIE